MLSEYLQFIKKGGQIMMKAKNNIVTYKIMH